MRTRHVISLIVIALIVAWLWPRPASAPSPSVTPSPTASARAVPLTDARIRVTKKTFGLRIDKTTSPVQPERFSGWHTGADFELLPTDDPNNVPVRVICSGPLVVKRTASGYGGVAVQSCTIADQAVTVIYGHLRLTSITAGIGQQLTTGDVLGVLGTGYSTQTDGEREHLHLGIHKGTAVSIAGYVQKESELSGWLDPLTILE